MKTFTKQPSEVLDYDVDLEEWFVDIPGDDIETVTVSVTGTNLAPDLVLGPDGQPEVQLIGDEPVRFKVWAGGGVNGVTYQITAKILTEGGREKEVDFKIKVKEL